MAPPQGPPRRDARPRGKSPAERAEEAAEVQRRLKSEAAARREASAAARRDAADSDRPGPGVSVEA
jgi:hypothetical protein